MTSSVSIPSGQFVFAGTCVVASTGSIVTVSGQTGLNLESIVGNVSLSATAGDVSIRGNTDVFVNSTGGDVTIAPTVGHVSANVLQTTTALIHGGTYDTGALPITISEADLISGYTYVGAGGAILTVPTAAAVQAALLARGIVAAAGMRMPPILVEETSGGAAITIGGSGTETIRGTAVVAAAEAAHITYVMTGVGATADVFVVKAT